MAKWYKNHGIIFNDIAIHISYWFLFLLIIFLPVYYFNTFYYALKIAVICVIPLIPPVYINFNLMDRYLIKKAYLKYVLWLILLILIGGVLAQAAVDLFIELNEGDTFATYLNPLLMIIITSGARYYRRGIKLQLQLREAQAKQYKAELDLLKHQVNPHFFFNTLNNLFAMAQRNKDEATASGIAKLSHIMRYMIYESNVEKIDVAKEIEQINNFIELQRLRFSEQDKVQISFTTDGELSGQKIVPMLLLPFVENAFKHGVSLVSDTYIRIRLVVSDGELHLSVENKINKNLPDSKDRNSGIGLTNIRRRLELIYPAAHEMRIDNDGDKFRVDLRIAP